MYDKILSSEENAILKKLIKTYKEKVHTISQQINHLLGQSEVQYLQKISLSLQKLKNADKSFLEQQNLSCRNQLLLTRHGMCRLWAQKNLGLSPNSPLAPSSIQAMKRTSKYTENFLFFPQKVPIVMISPMIRAKQTANLLLPQRKKYKIRLQINLTENSNKPSSTYLASHEHFNWICSQLSMCSNTKKSINFKLSSLLYGRDTFENLQITSKDTDRQILSKSILLQSGQMEQMNSENKLNQEIYYNNLDGISHQEIDLLDEEKKMKNLKNVVETLNKQNCFQDFWFFGHSKNIKSFIHSILGKKQLPKFAETIRLLLCVKQNKQKEPNQNFYFHPGYTIVVNQENGRIVCTTKFEYLNLFQAF